MCQLGPINRSNGDGDTEDGGDSTESIDNKNPHPTNLTNNINKGPGSLQNFEDILNAIGGFGFFQFLSLVLILILELPSAFVSFIPVFVSAPPKEWFCNSSNRSMSDKEICGCVDGEVVISTGKTDSIVAEWNLICNSSWVPDFITSIGMVGMLFGNLISCKLSDWYGRRYTFLGVSICMAVGHLCSALAPNPYFYGVCRFVSNFGMSGFLGVSSIYALEFQTPKWRQVAGSVGPWGEGIMLLALVAYFVSDWRLLTMVTSAPFLLIVAIFPLLPESPRWLIRNRKLKEAHQVLCYIAKINQTVPVDISDLKRVAEADDDYLEFESQDHILPKDVCSIPIPIPGHVIEDGTTGQQRKRPIPIIRRFNYLDFFRDPSLRVPTIYQMTIMCSTAITYYGISFNVRNMDGSVYLIVLLLGLSDAIGYPSALLICNRFGRRTSLAIYMTLGALFLTSLAILELTVKLINIPTSVIILCLLGKFCVAGGRSCARTLVGELYPTAVRAMGSGLGGVGAGLGAVVAPQLAYLGSHWPSIPYFVFACIAITGALFSFLLTETMGKPLSDNVSDSDSDSLSSSMDSLVTVTTTATSIMQTDDIDLPPPSPADADDANTFVPEPKHTNINQYHCQCHL